MSKPKLSTFGILFIVLVVAALLGPQMSKPAQGQQWKIVFEGTQDGKGGIYVVNPDGSGLQRLTSAEGGGWEPTWSPDRDKILVTSRLHGGGQADEEVYVMDADGSNMRRLTNTPGDSTSSWAADWSPDGQKIVFMSNRGGSPPGSDGYDLYVMNADGSNLRQLTRAHGWNATPAWSPDGEHIAFTSDQDGKDSGIWLIAPDGTGPRRLSDHGARPSWSPDGKKIAFMANGICVMDADGTNIQHLTHDDEHHARPAWSPDGERIAFMSNRDGGRPDIDAEYEIYVMDADGTNIQRLTHRPGTDGHPDWSPDGSEIVFNFVGEDGTGEEVGLWLIGADGTNLRQLTAGSGRGQGHPNW